MPTQAPSPVKAEAKILFQNYFKSVGPRTYAVQVKEAGNGNHFIVLTEGKRDGTTGDIRKTKLFAFSEDFESFFELIRKAEKFVHDHPVPAAVKTRQAKYWAKRAQREDSAK